MATATLIFSILGLTSLIGFKWWEERTGRHILPDVRARVGVKVHRGMRVAQISIPTFCSRIGTTWFEFAREWAKAALARGLLLSETALERVLHNLKRAERKHRGGEASSFLREVAEHKKQLREREGIE